MPFAFPSESVFAFAGIRNLGLPAHTPRRIDLLPVVIGPAMPLALRLAANALLEAIRGWMKASLAVRTAAGLGQCVSSEIERDSNF